MPDFGDDVDDPENEVSKNGDVSEHLSGDSSVSQGHISLPGYARVISQWSQVDIIITNSSHSLTLVPRPGLLSMANAGPNTNGSQ